MLRHLDQWARYSLGTPEAWASVLDRCGQWAEFDRIIRQIQNDGADFNYNYFGGKEEFEKLLVFSNEIQSQK